MLCVPVCMNNGIVLFVFGLIVLVAVWLILLVEIVLMIGVAAL